MDFQIPIQIPNIPKGVSYKDKIILTGSCFTEHIGDKLEELKFDILQNPNGILFDPHSVATSLVSYIQKKQYQQIQIGNWKDLESSPDIKSLQTNFAIFQSLL